MSANDQRPKGQPSHVSNGSGGKEEEAYLQQQPPHPMRAWSEQTSDGGYGAGPMSTAVSDSFFPNYYPPNMSYPFMNQGMGGTEGAWSSGADTMFGMGYDYSNMYGGFGFPFNNWDYSSEYWGNNQPVRKDQRGYPAEEGYYPPEMIPADSYGMVNGAGGPPPTATATAVPPETQEAVANVEQGIRNMRVAYRKDDNVIPPQQQQQQSQQQHQQQHHHHHHHHPPHQHQHQQPPPPPPQQQHHLQQVVAEGFGGDPSLMMPPSPVSATSASAGLSSMSVGNNSGNVSGGGGGGGDQSSGQSSKKTSWAAIASQPARQQIQMRPRTIPRAPVYPGKSQNMDIGTWDTRGNPSRVPMTMSQPLPNQPPSSIARYSRQPFIGQRQTTLAQPAPASVTIVSNSSNNNSGGSASSGANTNYNSSSGYSSGSNNVGVDGSNSVVGDSGSGQIESSSVTNASHGSDNSSNSVTINADNSNNSNSLSNSSVGGGGSGGSGNNSSSPYSGGYSSSHTSGNTESSNNRAVVNVNASMNGTHGGGDIPQPPAPVVDTSTSVDKYNPKEFVLNHKSARYFIIKSYSEDDIHRSIKYGVWCSTDHGNRRLDTAFREREGKGPIYLIYSVNGSGHFCGVAQMMSPVDYNKTTGIWHQDKWKGQIEVKWTYVKDVPNSQLRHIRLENNENKPVTNSRDTQEVPPEKGKQVLRIVHSYKNTTSIFDDFSHYEKRQEEDRVLTQHREDRGGHGGGRGGRGGGGGSHRGGGDRDHHHSGHGGDRGGFHRGGGDDRDQRDNHNRGGFGGDRDNRDRDHHSGGHHRDNQNNYRNDRNDYSNHRGGGGFGDRGDNSHRDHQRFDRGDNNNRNDNNRDHGSRGGFDREIRPRTGGFGDRDNRRGGHRQH